MGDTKFKPGQPRPKNAGRKKGTPNKRTLELQEVLAKHDFNPAEELIWIFQKQKEIYEARMKQTNRFGKPNLAGALIALKDAETTANDICQYAFPKKKAIEHTGEVGVKTFADFIAASAPKK